MTKAYSYLRFSTPEQSNGDSARRQSEAATAYAKAHELCLDDKLTFQDLGVSAFRGANAIDGALGQFVAAVDAGLVAKGSYLLVENLDRLSRDKIMPALNRFSDLLGKGVIVVTLSDGKVYTAESLNNLPDLMLSLLVMARAHDESAMKGQRLRAAWKAKKDRASKTGEVLTAMTPAWIRVTKEGFELIPERAEVVRRIFKLALAGHGKNHIARKFNVEGVPTFGASNGWHDSYAAKILANPAVIGRFQPMKVDYTSGKKKRVPDGEPIEGYFPRVIDDADFYKVKRSPSGISGKRPGMAPRNILAGLTYCHNCGSPAHYVNKGPGAAEYLACDARRRRLSKAKCAAPAVRYDIALTAIVDCLDDREMDLRAFLGANHGDRQQELRQAIDAIEGRIAEAEATISNLLDVLSRLPSPAIEERLAGQETALAGLRDEKARLAEALSTVAPDGNSADELIEAVRRWRQRLTSEPQETLGELAAWLHATLARIVKDVDIGRCDAARKYVAQAGPSLSPEDLELFDRLIASIDASANAKVPANARATGPVSIFVRFHHDGPEPDRTLAIYADPREPGKFVGLATRKDKEGGRLTVVLGEGSREAKTSHIGNVK